MERIAQCQCGALRAIASGEPAVVLLCHCHACQRRTGAVVGSSAYYAKDAVRVEGASKIYVRTGASGNKVHLHFCAECGGTVYWFADLRPAVCGIAVGAFADPAFPPPTISVWEESMHDWFGLPPTTQRFRQALK
jgi:hypothetical protein